MRQRRRHETIARLEGVDEVVMGDVANHLIVQMAKDFRIHTFDFEAGVVGDNSTGLETGGSLVADGGVKEQPRVRQ